MVKVTEEDKLGEFIENLNYKQTIIKSSESITPDKVRQIRRPS